MTGIKNVINGRIVNAGGFIVDRLELTNYAGETVDITNLVVSIVINESLYSPTLSCKLQVRDDSNFFSDFILLGRETIRMTISSEDAYDLEERKEIDLNFVVTAFPLFTRPSPHYSVYEISCISRHAYISSLKVISRGIQQGSLEGEIINILTSDCGLGSEKITRIGKGSTAAAFPLAIPYMAPLSAVEFLRRRCTNENSDNYFVSERLDGNILCATLSDLLNIDENPLYSDEYYCSGNRTPEHTLGSKKTYLQEIRRVISWTARSLYSTWEESTSGVYASKKKTVDIENKEKRTTIYTTAPDTDDKFVFPTLGTGSLSVDKTLNESPDGHIEFHHLPESSAYARLTEEHLLRLRASMKSLNNINLSLNLRGDLTMRVGHRINLVFPSAWHGAAGEKDPLLSGNYIVAGAIHRFENGLHDMSLNVKKL